MKEITTNVSESFQKQQVLFEMASIDQSVIKSDSWKQDLFIIIDNCYMEFDKINYFIPPDNQKESHKYIILAFKEYEQYRTDIKIGILNTNSLKLDSAYEHMLKIGSYIKLASISLK
jgi:hypothetical protein